MLKNEFDYIIVGAGSAGSVLANRLTEDGDATVLVLEAGPADHSIFIHMPSAFAYPLANDKYNWYYHSEPEPFMNNRAVYCPRGRVLGGSSSINGMVYIRGHALDYEGWARQQGLENWSYADCLPYFRKAETRAKGGDDYRGHDGPLKVSTGACKNPLYTAFIEAGQQAGYPYTEDMNGHQQEGLGPMDMTVHKGRRWSTAMAHLRPAMKRPNLEVRTRALVARVVFEDGSSPSSTVTTPTSSVRAARSSSAVAPSTRRRSSCSAALATRMSCAAWASGWWPPCAAWARTCKITSRPMCSTRARSPSPCIPR